MSEPVPPTGYSLRSPQTQVLTCTKAIPDGDGDWTVWFGPAWLTVKPDDIEGEPIVGRDYVVQLPMIMGEVRDV